MKILVVDDEADILRIARLSLGQVGGMEVIEVQSSAEALRKAEQERPDAILLDVIMPGTDGLATLRILKANPATAAIPVIFLTAKAHTGEVQKLLDIGAIGVVTKPFDPLQLAKQVRAILNGK